MTIEKHPTGLTTVHELRKNGYKVRVNHYRKYAEYFLNRGKMYYTGDTYEFRRHEVNEYMCDIGLDKGYYLDLLPNGGKTVVEITTPDNVTLSATAICNDKDAFNRKRAIGIALGRAFAKEEWTKREKQMIDTIITEMEKTK